MDVKTQAELRRRKILANAEARLKKITSRSADNVDVSNGSVEKQPPSNGSFCNGACSSNLPVRPIIGESLKKDDNIPTEEEPEFNHNEFQMEEDMVLRTSPASVPKTRTFRLECFFFLALGVVIRLLIHIGLSWIFLNNILGPFIVLCLPRLSSIFQRELELTGVFGLLAIAGAYQRRIHTSLKVFSALRIISQLFALYLFSFIIADFILAGKT